jgi:alpha-L-fucosidase 2
MTTRLVAAALLGSLLFNAPVTAQPGHGSALTLLYDIPASSWNEALPIGNGRLGAMVFGKVNEELIQLNEATLWSGGPVAGNVNPTAFDHLAQSRKALAAGDFAAANNLVKKMQGLYTEHYLPLGDLIIRQDVGAGALPVMTISLWEAALSKRI